MIRVVNSNLFMYERDTGNIEFSLEGEKYRGDIFIFQIKKDLNSSECIYKCEFEEPTFNVYISSETSALLSTGEYFWGIKLKRNKVDTHTIVGRGKLTVMKGV
jgi:hypothetical protein